MKKITLLIAMIAFVCGNAFAQWSCNFDDGTEGAKIAQTYGAPWTTWSNAPGGAEDGVFAMYENNMAAYFTYGNDQVFDFGLTNQGILTSGTWEISFDMLIPDGKDAYNNILHSFGGSGSEWATEVHYKTTSNGTAIQVGGVTYNFECPYDAWFNVSYLINLDQDEATFSIDGQEVVSWQYSLQAGGDAGLRQIGALDFFPPTNTNKSKYYIDNLVINPVGIDDEELIFDPFEEYTVGNKIALESAAAGHDWWTTWSSTPGSSEDGVVADYGGRSKCGHLTYGNDQVLLLGDEENGIYDLEFDILVPDGKNGYFNILHHFAGSGSVWALECYLHMSGSSSHSPGSSVVNVAGQTVTGPNVVYDQWMHFRLHVNTDYDTAEYYYTGPDGDEVLVCEWQWSLTTQGAYYGRKMAAMDFFPPQNASRSEYYLDNFSYKKIGGVSAPHLTITPESLAGNLQLNEMDMTSVLVSNSGNSIGDWYGYIEFGQGAEGTETAELKLHNGNDGNQIGSSSEVLREMAVSFRPSAYAGSAMGMRVQSLKYYINSSYQSTDGHYTFRIYGQGPNNQPGEMLGETTVNTTASGTWIEGVFDAPVYLTGETVWATVELQQAAEQYPLSMDDGIYGEDQDGNWLSTQGGPFSHCYSEGSFEGAWLITMNCVGTLVPATWVSMSPDQGSVMGGQEESITVMFNSINVPGGQYEAVMMIFTNDVNLPYVRIPVSLYVDPDDVVETVNEGVMLYPNPTSGNIMIKGENLKSVAIYNVAGQLVNIAMLNAVENSLNLNLGAGVYFFSVYDNEGNNTVHRVVVK